MSLLAATAPSEKFLNMGGPLALASSVGKWTTKVAE